MSRPRKRWPIVVGALVMLLFVLVFLFMRDDIRKDYPELAPAPVETGPRRQAAFDAWLVAISKIDRAPLDDAYRDDPLFIQRLAGSEPWRAEGVEKILTPNRGAIVESHAAHSLGPFALPTVDDLGTSLPHLYEFQRVAKLLRISAVERQVAGAHTEACETSIVGLRLADHLVSASGLLIDYLVGVAAHAIACAGAERLVAVGTPDPELVRLDAALKDEPLFHACLAETLRRELVAVANTIDSIEQLWPAMYGGHRKRPPMFLFKPNRTYNLVAERQRVIVDNATRPPGDREKLAPFQPRWFSSNLAGEQFIGDGHGGAAIVDKADHALAQRRLLRLKIALFRHHRDRGNLPEKLADLVPAYIEAVPADPFDGDPMRYDASRGAVWVVGSDLKDGGGSAAPEKIGFSQKAPDPTMFVFPDKVAPAP